MEWISTKDEFPPKGKILAFDAKYGDGHRYIALSDGDDYISECGSIDSHRLYQVTHWMPLPSPPKESA